jgi:hypothetical protein
MMTVSLNPNTLRVPRRKYMRVQDASLTLKLLNGLHPVWLTPA